VIQISRRRRQPPAGQRLSGVVSRHFSGSASWHHQL